MKKPQDGPFVPDLSWDVPAMTLRCACNGLGRPCFVPAMTLQWPDMAWGLPCCVPAMTLRCPGTSLLCACNDPAMSWDLPAVCLQWPGTSLMCACNGLGPPCNGLGRPCDEPRVYLKMFLAKQVFRANKTFTRDEIEVGISYILGQSHTITSFPRPVPRPSYMHKESVQRSCSWGKRE